MKRIMIALCGLFLFGGAYTDTPSVPMPVPRVSIFSTSTDWQAITGLMLNEYRGEFKTDPSLQIYVR